MPDTYRAFIALPVPPAVVDFLKRVQDCLVGKGVHARWVRPGSMHLTLKFLGPLESARVDDVCTALEMVIAHHSALQLTVQGLGGFPNRRRPRVIWMGIGGENHRLEDLHRDIEAGLDTLGWPREKRPFRGHLTLARAKGRRPFDRSIANLWAACEPEMPLGFTAESLALYRSELKPQGAVYHKLGHWELKATT